MTPQERDLLSRFLDELTRAQPGAKDAEAAAQIDRALGANGDAAYVLVQHAILADAALHDAREEAADLRDRLDALQRQLPSSPDPAPAAQPSFLGALFGRAQPNPPPGAGGWGAGSAGPPGAPPYGYGAPGGGPFSGGGGLGSFLRSAGTTAAGVAGGAFLFEGLSDLLGGGRREMFGDGGAAGFADVGGGGQGFAGDSYSGDDGSGQFDIGSDG